jgi:hypothetical protein
MTRPRPSTLFFWMIALCLVTIGAVQVLPAVQLGLHVYENGHSAESEEALSYFDADGQCRTGNGAILYSPVKNRWLYACFIETGRIALWVVVDQIKNNQYTREITRFIAEPRYLTSCIGKMGYQIMFKSGDLPVWFLALFTEAAVK